MEILEHSQNQTSSSAVNSTSISSAQSVSRRTVLGTGVKAAVGALSLGPLLAACGGSTTSASSGPVTIQYAALVDQTGEQTAEINTFNQLHAGKIKVDYLQLPSVATDQYNKFVSAFRSGSATPDVVHIDVTWPAQFATPGWLAPLDQYANASYLQQFWPSAANVGQVNGKLYGIQRYIDTGLLYYRTDLLEKYAKGVVPQTRDDLNTLAQEILTAEAKNGVKYGYLFAGKKIEAVVDEWLELLWGAGGNIGVPGQFVINSQSSIDALQYEHDLIYKQQLSPAGTNTYATTDILTLFSNGQAPFMRNWVFAYALANNSAKSKVAGKVGLAPTLATTGNQGHGCTGGWVLAINANSQHKDEAWQFIDFLLSKETQTSLVKNAGLVSSRPDVVNDAALQASYPQLKQLANLLNVGQNRPKLTHYNSFTTPLQAAINGVLSNLQSPADALNSVQSQVASIV